MHCAGHDGPRIGDLRAPISSQNQIGNANRARANPADASAKQILYGDAA
jgi:hypothetical protein